MACWTGFFHSGTVRVDDSRLSTVRYVYDCGSCSQKKLESKIDEYVKTIQGHNSTSKKTEGTKNNSEIKLFFVSHFDRDHINGITALSRQVRIDRFIIPFVKPKIRLLNIARMMMEDNSFPSNSADDQFVIAVAISPEEAFLELTSNPEERYRVIQIFPSDYRNPIATEVPPINLDINSTNRNTTQIYFNLDGTSDTISLQTQGKIVWQWESHVLEKFDKTSISRFEDHLVSNINATAASHPIRISDSEDIFSTRNMRNWLENPDNRNILKEAYRVALGKNTSLNCTSLMLYSGPSRKIYSDFWSYSNNRGSLSHSNLSLLEKAFQDERIDTIDRTLIHGGRLLGMAALATIFPQIPSHLDTALIGWLGLGDIEFDDPSSVNNLFNHRKAQVRTLAIPHHGSGSDKNWNDKLLHDFLHPIICVASVGVNYNRYGHPNRNVVMDINGVGSTLIVVTEAPKSQFEESVHYILLN